MKNLNEYKRIAFGFTLAEVLITLGIIGVVAALTIPVLMQNSQKQETVSKLQKAFSTIAQAHKNAEVEFGSSTGWDTPAIEADPVVGAAWWDKYFIPYANLSIIKSCTESNASGCWASNIKGLDGTAISFIQGTRYLVLKDGTTLYLGGVYNTFSGIYIDINGLKQPNVIGKDIFIIYIYYKTGYVAFPGFGSTRDYLIGNNINSCNKQSGTAKGSYCGALIQQDGWQIKDDYPWN